MNSRLRPHWVALAAAALLVALSVSSALGADPADDADKNHGQQVSDFVHSLLFGDPASDDEDTPADEDVQDEEEPVDEESADEVDSADVDSASGQPDNHGACVSAVAMSDEVGGDQENHGGAVSEAARVTCRDDVEGEGEDAEVTSAEEHGNSANAHNKPHGHGRGHGRGGS